MKTSRILIVGGGRNQLAIINEALRRNATVIVVDSNNSPPGKVLADYFYQVDTTNKEEILKIGRRHQITAVVTDQSDAAIPTAAFVADEMNLPGIGSKVAGVFTNKFAMREFLSRNASQYQPSKYERFTEKSEALDFLEKWDGNLGDFVVKPIDSQGSKGVSRLTSSDVDEQVQRAFNESRSGTIILEEFVIGDEFSVDSVVLDFNITCLAIGRKEHFPNNDCLDQRIVFLGSFLKEFHETLVCANRVILTELGLETGLAHAEFIISGNRVLLVEVAARGGGAGISSLISPYISGFDTTGFLVDFATGTGPLSVRTSVSESRCAVLNFFKPTNGVVTGVEVRPAARQLSQEIFLSASLGNLTYEPRDSRSRIGHFVVTGETYSEAIDRERAVLNSVDFKYG